MMSRLAVFRSPFVGMNARIRRDCGQFFRDGKHARPAGGEGGIRTLGTGCPVRQISNLVPSTTRPPLRALFSKHLRDSHRSCPSPSAHSVPTFSRKAGRVHRAEGQGSPSPAHPSRGFHPRAGNERTPSTSVWASYDPRDAVLPLSACRSSGARWRSCAARNASRAVRSPATSPSASSRTSRTAGESKIDRRPEVNKAAAHVAALTRSQEQSAYRAYTELAGWFKDF